MDSCGLISSVRTCYKSPKYTNRWIVPVPPNQPTNRQTNKTCKGRNLETRTWFSEPDHKKTLHKKSADLLVAWWTALISEEALAIGCLEGFPDSGVLRISGERRLGKKKSSPKGSTLGDLALKFECIWVFPKIMVPPNHPFVHRVFHEINHSFWGTKNFWFNTHIIALDFKTPNLMFGHRT